MRTIRTIHDGTVAQRGLARLQRIDRGDQPVYCHHGWRGVWSWGTNPIGWVSEYDRYHPASWGYVYVFTDGTRGVSTVRDMNQALAALGHRVDPEVEHLDGFVRLLDEALASDSRPRVVYANWHVESEAFF